MDEDSTYPVKRLTPIALRIAQKRNERGYTQAVLASKIGKSAGAVGQFETAANKPSLETLERIAAVLETTVEWLLTGDDPEELVRAQTVNEKHTLALIRQLPVAQQATAIAMLEGLTAKFTKP